MAVDSATISTASGILKESYEPGVVTQIAGSGPLWASLDKSSEDIVQGKYAVLNLRLNPSQAIGSIAELAALPAAQRTRNVETQILLAFIYGTMRVTGPLMEASRTDKGAFIRAIRNEVDGLTEGLKRDVSRQVYGTGRGNIALLGTLTSSTTLQLDASANMQYFEVGMQLDVRSGTFPYPIITNGGGLNITSINPSTKTLSFDNAVSVATTGTESVYRVGSLNNELIGLDAIVDNVTPLYSIDPAVAGNERWASYVDAAFGTFSLDKFQAAIDAAEDNGGEWITSIYSAGTARQLYLTQLSASRRFIPQENPTNLDGGFKGLSYTGGGEEAVWFKDKFCQAGRIYALRNKDKRIQLRRQKDFEFITVKGEAWLPDIYGANGVDAYKAVMATYAQLVANKRNVHMKLLGVTD
jgi:hypothetical protein